MRHQLAGGNSSWCPKLESRTTHRARKAFSRGLFSAPIGLERSLQPKGYKTLRAVFTHRNEKGQLQWTVHIGNVSLPPCHLGCWWQVKSSRFLPLGSWVLGSTVAHAPVPAGCRVALSRMGQHVAIGMTMKRSGSTRTGKRPGS